MKPKETRRLLKKNNVTQRMIADALGFSEGHVSMVLRGRRWDAAVLRELANQTGTSYEEIKRAYGRRLIQQTRDMVAAA